MILFFRNKNSNIIAVNSTKNLSQEDINALKWLFSGAELLDTEAIDGTFIGPRIEMITPWSTTAVEITQNMNILGITRIEEFFDVTSGERVGEPEYDKMLQRLYKRIDQNIFTVIHDPEPVKMISDISEYNKEEGLALSDDEIEYLEGLSKRLGRYLTDSEVFGFSQVNSEHCRHKIFNGTFIIDGKEMESSLFKMIKLTSAINPGRIISAYKDNCAFVQGPEIDMFYPQYGDKPSDYIIKKEETVISLKAETHNFPTTVEPFNGAATGSGGEIRDRIAGGKGSFPIAGTSVYMTSYPRFKDQGRDWENTPERKWLYHTPREILTKASNGASDFGNKFGQPLICGSLQTMEHSEGDHKYGFDKVIMLAGGIGYTKKKESLKDTPEKGDKVIMMGGDNYRIGMGGGAVSSVNTGEFDNAIELNAIQRSNPEMQKRVYNAIRSYTESDNNPVISVHDHGAGGHLNCLSELVEERGGDIDISKLPVGDPTLSAKEIIGNESQERMGLVAGEKDIEMMKRIAQRERAPFYVIGDITGKYNFTLKNHKTGETPIDLALSDFFGSTPKTILEDKTNDIEFSDLDIDPDTLSSDKLRYYIEQVLQLESVACKDWLTNKVDRCVTGLVAQQQCDGEIQLPLSNFGATTIGYNDTEGIATSIGHAPMTAMIDPAAGSRIAIAEALTNIAWTPVQDGLKGISLSANWMWPAKNPGENSRLFRAVKGASDFAISLGINIPTGKDSMSMTQKYPDGEKVLSPGTLIVSTVAQSKDVRKNIKPTITKDSSSNIYYIPFTGSGFELGGSAFAQITGKVGRKNIDVPDPDYFAKAFAFIQNLVDRKKILAGHDISSGGMVTTLLEMCFANTTGGLNIDLKAFGSNNILFSEKPGVIIQTKEELKSGELHIYKIGSYSANRELNIELADSGVLKLDIDYMRDLWYKTSYLFDVQQSGEELAGERYKNYKLQPLVYKFPESFTGLLKDYVYNGERRLNAAVIRESGSNSEREMAWCLYQAGFNVRDVHTTDLTSGRETLDDINFIVFVGGFSNADTLGSAKGWAGALMYNEKAKQSIERFYSRRDTLSLGVCNGCQLMGEMGLMTPENREKSPKMQHNSSHKLECNFVGVTIQNSPSVLLKSLEGTKLGIWIAHGEGKFHFPEPVSEYNIAVRYNYDDYPANPNGSPEGVAAVSSVDGRHLAIMPHPERTLMPWNWAYYNQERKEDQISPWIEMFINGRKWLEYNIK